MASRLTCLLVFLFGTSIACAEVQVLTTIRPLELIVRAIVDDADSVGSLVPVNQSPHHYALKPSDRIALDAADLLVWVGPSLESFLIPTMAGSVRPNQVVLELGARSEITRLNLRDGLTGDQSSGHSQLDPHIWLNPDNARQIAHIVTDSISRLNPGSEAVYKENFSRFSLQLDEVDRVMARQLSEVRDVPYLVYHDAYQYLETKYGLAHSLALVDDPEMQPGMRHILTTRERIKSSRATCLFTDVSSRPATIATLLSGYALTQVQLDILGNLQQPDAAGYGELMLGLARSIHDCLQAGRAK